MLRAFRSPETRRHPGAIFVQLTTGCNAKCTSCPHPFTYGAKGRHQPGNMTPEMWDRLIEQIADAGYEGEVGLYLHHEPLLVNDLADKIKDVNTKTKAFVVLSTNGALLTAERRKALIDAGPKRVHINISSADPAQYSEIMKLTWAVTQKHTHAFIAESAGIIDVEINCPVLPGVDTQLLQDEFPDVKVNLEFWANSRGGLLEGITAQGKGSRFKFGRTCMQRPIISTSYGTARFWCAAWTGATRASPRSRTLPTWTCSRLTAGI